jgi:SagB-type dehydrogenase family enzyme
MLLKLNEASMLNHSDSFQAIGSDQPEIVHRAACKLPSADRLSYDLAAALQARYSPETEFILRQVSPTMLAALLNEALQSFKYRNDLDGKRADSASRVSLHVSLYGVEGIANGAYRYESSEHVLQPLQAGDHRGLLQYAMSLDNVNLHQVPLCFHVAGDLFYHYGQLGYRGYRIQQMEAGMLVHSLLLAASASGMGGRPLLGFDAGIIDKLYGLTACGQTSLIQIPVGYCRSRSRLEGSLAQ